jgi:hypothetical protein
VAFLCPECSAPKSLMIALKIELPPDDRSDEMALQIVECSECGFAGIAVYEESRRGALGTESFHHLGYRVSEDDLNALRRRIKACPNPSNSRCRCSAHRVLGRTDASGRWSALDKIRQEGAFALNL